MWWISLVVTDKEHSRQLAPNIEKIRTKTNIKLKKNVMQYGTK
jgi:hypothetical protein